MERCGWCGGSELYRLYHDTEWGVPVFDDQRHFEFLVLESAQAGLSWLTVLKKRENYRRAYDGFDPEKVALYSDCKKEELLADAGLIRNRRKIEASLVNAQKFLEVREEFGSFAAYLWGFTGGRPIQGRWRSLAEVPARTELSDRLAADMKKRGFKFLGSIIMYSHLQATGLINDHILSCFRYKEIKKAPINDLFVRGRRQARTVRSLCILTAVIVGNICLTGVLDYMKQADLILKG